jgi:hypothetical protein
MLALKLPPTLGKEEVVLYKSRDGCFFTLIIDRSVQMVR